MGGIKTFVILLGLLVSGSAYAQTKSVGVFKFPNSEKIIYVHGPPYRIFKGEPGSLAEIKINRIEKPQGDGLYAFLMDGSVLHVSQSSGWKPANADYVGITFKGNDQATLAQYRIDINDPVKPLPAPKKTFPTKKSAESARTSDKKTAANAAENAAARTGKAGRAIAPVIFMSPNEKDAKKAQVGAFVADPSPIDLGQLRRIRDEMLAEQAAFNKKQAVAQSKTRYRDVITAKTRQFTPESFTFFVAVGAVTFTSIWKESGGDPMAMEQHILALKDPIAHLSFYTFMQSQGIYTNFHIRAADRVGMDQAGRARMMKSLSYKGLAVGSIASDIVTELGHSIMECVSELKKGDAVSEIERCDNAWKEWTVRNKFQQFFPQIMSMWASQAMSGLIEKGVEAGFKKMAIGELTKNATTKLALNGVFKINAVEVALSFVPGKIISKGVRWIGSALRIGVFVSVDQLLHNYVYRPLENILNPSLFTLDEVTSVNTHWSQLDAVNWDFEKLPDDFHFDEKIEAYTEGMVKWRGHLNADADAGLQGWEAMTSKLNSQIDYANRVYGQFVSDLYWTKMTQLMVIKGEWSKDTLNVMANMPLRTLPYAGVRPGNLQPVKGAMSIDDMYLLNINELETKQAEHVRLTAKKVLERIADWNEDAEKKLLGDMLNNLMGNDRQLITDGMVKLKEIYRWIYEESTALNSIPRTGTVMVTGHWQNQNPYEESTRSFLADYGLRRFSDKFNRVIVQFYAELGRPDPVTYSLAGFSKAVTMNTDFIGPALEADYGHFSIRKKYNLPESSDFMIYKMVCGPAKANISTLDVAGVNLSSPEFNPPSLLQPRGERDGFCKSFTNYRNFYGGQIDGLSLGDYVTTYINYDALGNLSSNGLDAFQGWWANHMDPSINEKFKEYDAVYEKSVQLARDNYIGKKSTFKKVADFLNTSEENLPNNIHDQLMIETSLYAQILNRALITNPVSLKIGGGTIKDYVSATNARGKKYEFDPIYNLYDPTVATIYKLINAGHWYIRSEKFDYAGFEQTSKQIDAAINKALYRARLMRVKAAPQNGSSCTALIQKNSPSSCAKGAAAAAEASGSFGLKSLEPAPQPYTPVGELEPVHVDHPTPRQKAILAAVAGLKTVQQTMAHFVGMRAGLKAKMAVGP